MTEGKRPFLILPIIRGPLSSPKALLSKRIHAHCQALYVIIKSGHIIHQACYKLSHQHGSPEVEVLEELRDEDMSFHGLLCVPFFHLFENVNEPLKVLLVGGHPDEVHLDKIR